MVRKNGNSSSLFASQLKMLVGIVGGLYVVSVVWQDEIQNKNVILPKLSCQKITKGQKEVTKNYM